MIDDLRTIAAIVVKDSRIEWRTRTALASSLVFAGLVLMIVYMARDTARVSSLDVAPAALWVTFSLGAMLGMNRAFLLERDNGSIDALRLSGVRASVLFIGKFLSNVVFVGVVQLVTIPVFILMYDVPLDLPWGALALLTVMATIAFVSVGTVLSAMAVQTGVAHMILPVLLLPFLVTPVVGAVQVTTSLLYGMSLSDVSGWFKLLAAFDIAFITLSTLLFEATIKE